MQVGIMKADHGTIPADQHAITAVSQIMEAMFSPAASQTIRARKFEIALLDILGPHHGKVEKHERDQIEAHGIDRLSHPLDPREHLDAVIADIAGDASAIGTITVPDPDKPGETMPFDLGAHLAKPEVKQALAGLIGARFATQMDIERSWHADRNAHHPEAKAYRAARTEHGAAHVHAHIHKYRSGHAA